MKKLLTGIIIGVSLTGSLVFANKSPLFSTYTAGSFINLIVDNQTGCHYINTHNGPGVGLTPRLNSKGQPLCVRRK